MAYRINDHRTPEHMRAIAKLPRPGRRNPQPIPARNFTKPPPGSAAARYYSAVVRGVTKDIGEPSTVVRELVVNFGGTATLLRAMNSKIVAGRRVDVAEYAVLCNTLVKLGSRIGLRRVPKEVPSLETYLHDLQKRSANGNGDAAEELEIDDEAINSEDVEDAAVPDHADGE